jgi:putative SOS response-associated peptidase YedK
MCNLYSLTTSRQALVRLFKIPHNRAAVFEPLPAIFPGRSAPVIRVAADGEREMLGMSWGFVLPQHGKAPKRVTNVRDDKARTSSYWIESFNTRRCLVPATSFAEPREVTPATWHWFALKQSGMGVTTVEPRPVFAFAGIWRRYKGITKKDGPLVEIDTYSFMTTTPNALVSTINHERMPVLLTTQAAADTWLNGTPDAAFALVQPADAAAMHIVRAGFDKDDPQP